MSTPKPGLLSVFKSGSGRASQTMVALRTLSETMVSTLNPAVLAEKTTQIIAQSLGARVVILFGVNYEVAQLEDYGALYRLGSSRPEKIPELVIKGDSPLLRIFRDQRQAITLADLQQPGLQTLPAAERTWLQSLNMAFYIPVHTRDEWAGMLAVGMKASGEKYNEHELALLGTMTDMLSLAMQNIRLGESLLRVNNEFRRTYQSMEQSNRQLKQLLSKLEKVDRSKSDFIHIASHELRTPLTVMLGYNELLREDPELKSNEYHAQLIDGIHKGIMRMHEVVESMLVMATIDARALALNKQQVSIGAVIHAVHGSLITVLEERRLTLAAEKISDLPLIEADEEALKKVFHQVISNAIKYTPDGGSITITGSPATIGPENMTEPGVEVVVSDTGIGIDPKHLEMIFTKFYMTGDLAHHSSGKTKFKGAGPGLGLAIAKGIVEAHGGKIWATSSGYDEEKCPGSQFHILLPLKNVLE